MDTQKEVKMDLTEINEQLTNFKGDDIELSATPAKINFVSYPMLKKAVDDLSYKLRGYVVTEQTYYNDKKLKANLNKLSKQLTAKRLEIVKEVDKEVIAFNDQVKALSKEIDAVSEEVAEGVKYFDDKAKKARHEVNINEISKYLKPLNVPLEAVNYEAKWDNKTNNFKAMMESVKEQAQSYLDNSKIITKKAEENNQVASAYTAMLTDYPLSEVLAKMDNAIKAIQEQAERDRARKLAEIAEQKAKEKVVGNKLIDKNTGEKLADLSTIRLTVKVTDYQSRNLARYLKDNGIDVIKAERLGK